MFPGFNPSGVIPPFIASPVNQDGAPYETNLTAIVYQLGTTPERRALLQGLLDFRAALRNAGITAGFQILNGSFTENCEQLRGVPPGDIDVVTFAHVPAATQAQLQEFLTEHGQLFDPPQVKEQFRCDAYFVDLGKNAQLIVEDTFYWYGLFSHQKTTFTWKGTLRVPLMADDVVARQLLMDAVGVNAVADTAPVAEPEPQAAVGDAHGG